MQRQLYNRVKTVVSKFLQPMQYYGIGVRRAEKFNFSILLYYIRENRSHRPGEIITIDFIDGFNATSSFFMFKQNSVRA